MITLNVITCNLTTKTCLESIGNYLYLIQLAYATHAVIKSAGSFRQ